MAQKTGIEWCDHSFNPWWGCQMVSPGCANCYAERTAHHWQPQIKLWGEGSTRLEFSERHWEDPIHWNKSAERAGKRRRVFCGSMCDVFECFDEYPGPVDERRQRLRQAVSAARENLWELIQKCPWLDWLILSKRPENFQRLLPWSRAPWKNVWLGISAENQEWYDRRAPILSRTPAAVRFLSLEPLIGPIQLGRTFPFFIDWVIVGGESGPKAREIQKSWVRSLRNQCKVPTNEVPFFFKQWGGLVKKKAGRLLDGREWLEFPAAFC